jgi:hemolysin III
MAKTIRIATLFSKRAIANPHAWSQVRPLREEISSAVIQGSAAAASAAGLAYLVERYGSRGDAVGLAALVVYGASMFTAFLSSALYHGTRNKRIKSMLQQLDHCTIFLFIAGTYTPIALLPLKHHHGVALFASLWTLAFCGIALRLCNIQFFRAVAIPLYLLMGWLGLGWSVPLYKTIGPLSILLMFAGATTYTVGLLFYRWHRLPFSNSIWHLFVVAGGSWFFAAIARFLPT